ncbi:SDR family NAD(P)-dependent oxidoreductase [Streptacidiphilus sp. PB12-B1b]|uniref:type I polyketide synthase n=1 Tax=Streptacidiphilus sp. PB12-B1b TaxID=2705012 RepID=UPI0015FBBDFE|nr:type I polyketide synthase [Streptacidiphilus sp. PB12-B1b]QMU77448.1 SDR family NAD(P)-dependent oxidoreductase [Streptacidiphilus sp. PB12-B1b]
MAQGTGAGSPQLWMLTGGDSESLAVGARTLHDHLVRPDQQEWHPADVGRALSRAAAQGNRRAALVADHPDGFLERLAALADGRGMPGLVEGEGECGRVAFVFPGQGSQWPGMAAELLASCAPFRQRMDDCAQALEPHLDWSLLDLLRDPGRTGGPGADRADVVQPALFAVTLSLAALWRSHGVEPGAVLGHSVGEITAACLADALSLDDSARVVALWSQAQATLAGRGEMVSVMAGADAVAPWLDRFDGRLALAAVNGPHSVIVSGDADAAEELIAHLDAAGVRARTIAVGLAAHSAHIDAILPRMRADLAPIRPRPAQLPYYSALTGDLIDNPLLDADYWCRNLRSTVRFEQATRALLRDGFDALIEVSPHTVLTSALTDSVEDSGARALVLGTLRREQGGEARFLTSLGELRAHGYQPDRDAVHPGQEPGGFELPLLVPSLTPSMDSRAGGPGKSADDPAAQLRSELGRLPVAGQRAALLKRVGREVAGLLGRSGPVPEDGAFLDLGFDSVTAVELRNRLARQTGLPLPSTTVFDYPTPAALADFLRKRLTDQPTPEPEPDAAGSSADDPVVIVGMGCRYPGAETPDQLWELLSGAVDAVSAFPDDRGWDTAAGYHPTPGRPGRYYQREAGFLYQAGEFDAEFFGISPREALAMDPQQRLLLETTWEMFEQAGIDPTTLRGSRTGVFVGAMTMDYGPRLQDGAADGGHLLTGNTGSVASGRLAYTLGLEGAAITVDTACSSSLVALHLAVQALRSGECSLALAGGATVMPTLGMFVEFSRQGGLAPDGRCKAFAAGADGFGLAEGVGMLLLERLSQARRNGHQVLAVVRGSAVNQDGASNGLTAPNGPSQQRVIRAALADAGLSADEVDLVEAHGTGTRLGDPIEAQALLATYGQNRSAASPLWLGSLKSNIGHTQAAAGVGGVIKTVLALLHGMMPKTLHVDGPTPQVDWSAGAVRLLTEARPWPESDRPRRAGISSFGISGTNAHVLLEQAPASAEADPGEPRPDAPAALPWVLSARSAQALTEQARRLSAALRTDPRTRPQDVGLSLAVTRTRHPHRAVVVGDSAELLTGLDALAQSVPDPGVVTGVARPSGQTVFVFPGQGSQWVGMAAGLLDASPVFAERIAACERLLAPLVGWSLVDVLRGVPGAVSLGRVDVVQPVLFAVMVSLAEVWRSFGVVPDAVVGHSQGEIAAACVAGGLSLGDGVRVVVLRSRALVGLAGGGGMASVPLPVGEVEERLGRWGGRLSVAAVNGPASTVVSGDAGAVAELVATVERARRIEVDYASHSAHMDGIQAELTQALGGIVPRAADIPLYSTLTGGWLDTTAMDADYWFANLRRPVAFDPAVRTLAQAGFGTFIEVSAHPVLTVPVQEAVEAAGADAVVLGTLRRGEGGWERMLLALGEAHAHGVPVDWTPALPAARRIALPGYAFQRSHYWLTAATPQQTATQSPASAADPLWESLEALGPGQLSEALGVSREALADVLPALSAWRSARSRERRADSWRYRIGWRPVPAAPADAPAGRWLAVLPHDPAQERTGRVADLLAGLAAVGVDLVPAVVPGGPGASRAELAALVADAVGGRPLAGVLSLLAWEERPHPDHPELPGSLALTLVLTQALADADVNAPLWLLTQGTAVLGPAERPGTPAQAAVAALGRTVALEHPQRWGGLVDLPVVLDERAARRLCAVLGGAVAEEEQMAVRSTGVHGRRLLAAPVPPTATGDDWRPRGTVLVTGGTGAVGAHTARRLAAQGAERLLLLSRRGPDAPGATELRAELAGLGAVADIVRCDATDRAALAAVIADIPEAYPLTVVVHAAGVLDDGVLDALTPARLAASLQAKLTVAQNLHEATAGCTLSAFVVFSSVMGVVGSAGQGNYAAANAAVDALVAQRRAVGLPGTAIAWGAWPGGGMLADGVADRLRDFGMPPMEPEAAVTAIGRAVTEDDGLVLVADVDWPRFADGMGLRASALLSALPQPAVARSAPATGPDAAADPTGGPDAVGSVRARLAELPAHGDRVRLLTDLVRAHAATVLRHRTPDAVLPDRAFAALGFDSLTAVELRNRLGAATGLALPATVLFDHPTPTALAIRLLGELGTAEQSDAMVSSTSDVASSLDEPIAVIGMGCRFPGGVERPEQLWQLLAEGVDAVGDWPSDRGWDAERLYDPDPDRPGTTYSRQGGFLRDAAEFDAEFFGISPREALAMDPQQRLLLETSWEAVEAAGQDPIALKGRQIGVYFGTNGQDYLSLVEGSPVASEGHFLTGNTASVLSGRVSYVLGLEGPALTLDTACSSSLVALHLAVQALRRGDCEQALTGGVTVMSTPKLFVEFSRQRGLAPDGRCKAFSAQADGTGWGEGAGVLLLERLSDAQRHGHPVLALVTGSAVNQDGASNGLTAPNGPSQQHVITAALADAGLRPEQIDAVEAHGTGTVLGDPIEAQALQAVYGRQRTADRPLWLGSVKSNLGHTQAAAGVAGVMKMVLALRAGELPATLHAEQPNPHVDWSAGTVRLLTERAPWPQTGGPRRAGVSSFGISGTNAHVILEQAPAEAELTAVAADRPGSRTGVAVPLLLSARTPQALRAQAERLHARLAARPEAEPVADLADVAHALATGRAAMECRAAVLDREPTSVRRTLRALAADGRAASLLTGTAGLPGRTAFLFPGQGSQRPAAGAQLYQEEPVFADALDEVFAELDQHLPVELREVLFAPAGTAEAGLLERTRYTQPALFALETALFRLVEHWGVRPDLLLGHSIGELAAAHVAGVLDLRDACALVAARGRLMDALPEGGAMVAVEATEQEVRRALAEPVDPLGAGTVDIAAVNGPTATVLSGDAEAVLRLAEVFRARGCRTAKLTVSHAFHSARMEPMLDEFRHIAAGLTYSAPRIAVVSNLTGETATAAELCSPDYWARQVRGTVRFLEGARRLRSQGATTFLEVGPGGVLSGMLHGCLDEGGLDEDGGGEGDGVREVGAATVPLLRAERPEAASVTAALAALHVRGVPVDWSAGTAGARARRIDLPTYAFQRRRFWPEPAVADADRAAAPASTLAATVTGPEPEAADRRRYRIDWRPVTAPNSPRLTGSWLLVVPDQAAVRAAARACRQALTAHGAQVETVRVPDGVERGELARLLRSDAAGVLSLLALAEGRHPRLDVLGAGLAGTLTLVQALGDAGTDAPLWCATRAAVSTGGRGTVRPEQAQVWGLGRVAALEHPHRWGGLVDLPAELDAAAQERLCAVLAGLEGEDQVAIRPSGVLGRRLGRAPAPDAPAGPSWKPRGTVLVTGGTGGLGAQVARWLAANGAEHLVLLSRSGPQAPGAAALAEELAALGVRCTLPACDVADLDALADVLDELDVQQDTVRAVVHAAGLTSDTRIEDCTLDLLAEETAAKTSGADHLDALFQGRELDAFVLFSSISATWGSAGQGCYAAANAHLDAVAARRRSHGLPATSVAWGPWAGAGMARGAVGEALRRHGLVPMAAESALAALRQALELDETELIVTEVDWERFAPVFRSARDSALLRALPEAFAAGRRTGVTEASGDPAATGGAAWRQRVLALPEAERGRLLRELVRTEAAAVLGHDTANSVDADRPFRDVGFDSLTAVELRNRLIAVTGLPLPLTSVFDHPTAAALGGHLSRELTGSAPTPADPASPAAAEPGEPLAIVAMACRFPGGVRTPEELWQLVAEGGDAIGELPEDRGWPLDTLYDPDPDNPGTFYTTGGGFLDGAAEFDAEFFGISPREALAMDPQQRLLLETAWEALERAGIDPASVRGSEGGVYVGVASQGYATGPHDPAADVEGHLLSGNVTSVASGRIAYTLGLGGPAVTVETACSSSLVALHLAGQALRSGDCSFALVGGAAVMASPDVFVEFSRQQGLSPDGRCRSFADGANGTGWGEGVGVLLVERLSDARRHGHPVLALVRGTAINQDGASNGLTAPSGPAQQRVIRQALANAGLSGSQIDLVEAHGTGTVLGDPIEAQALMLTYGQGRSPERPLWLGSLKSNIGHTQAAAGVAGVIKTVMALRHAVLPQTLHAGQASSRIDWAAGAVRLLAESRPWDAAEGPRRAAVSAFGMSGTNAHAVLEQAPDSQSLHQESPVASDDPGTVPWLLSARNPAALRRQARRLREHVQAEPSLTTAELARALATTRSPLPCRAAAIGADRSRLLQWLDALAEATPAPDAVEGWARGGRTAFVFPGQGSQWLGMAAGLLDSSNEFAEAVADCGKALARYTDWSLEKLLRNEPDAASLERVDVVQPALFAVMVALAAEWRSAGVHPDAVVGHSQGEIAAACVAGALSLEDAALVVALRSRALLQLAGQGGMVSVAASAQRVEALIGSDSDDRICVAAVNGPDAVVVAGRPPQLDALLAACERDGLRARRIPVDYAAHSAQVADLEDELRTALAGVRPRPCTVPLYSSVTGEPVEGTALDADYWYRNLREPVAFERATGALLEAGHDLFVEVSPHPVLLAGIEGVAEQAGRAVSAVGTLRRGDGGPDRMLAALAEAWSSGAPVDWAARLGGLPGADHVPLPTYPFERDRYWLPTPGRSGGTAPAPTSPPSPGQAADGPEQDDAPARLAAQLARLDRPGRRQALLDLVTNHASAVLGHSGSGAVRPERAFSEAGFDSMLAVRFRNRLCAATGLAVPPTVVFDYPTPASLADYLHEQLSAAAEPVPPVLAELDRLAATLAAVAPGSSGSDEIGRRLDALLREWGQRTEASSCPPANTPAGADSAGPAPDGSAAATATASADELFALLDTNFGMA